MTLLKISHTRPPGSPGLPLLGNFLEFKGDILGYMQDQVATYGDISFFRIWNYRSWNINHPDLVAEVLVKQNSKMRKPWDVRQLKGVLGNGLLTSDGEFWQQHRRLIQPAFHNSRIRAYGQSMVAQTQAWLAQQSADTEIDIHEEMMRLTLDIVAETLFGVDVKAEARKVGQAVAVLSGLFEKLMSAPIPLPDWAQKPFIKSVLTDLDGVVYRLIRQKQAQQSRGDDLLSWMLDLNQASEAQFTERQLRDELVTLLLAGHETTAIGLSWTWMLLAQHPRVWHFLQQEIKAVLKGTPPTAEDLPRMPYTQALIKESLRLYPPAWGLGREALEPLELGGQQILAGDQIWMSTYILQRDGRFWQSPEAFRPERWLQPDQHPKYAYFPFGGGPRVCIGLNFALMEMALILVTIAQQFRFDLDPSHPIAMQPAITLRPRYGIKGKLSNRDCD